MGRAPGAKNKPKEENTVNDEANGNVLETKNIVRVGVNTHNHKAYSIVKEQKGDRLRYVVVQLLFDLNTETLGSVTRIEESEDSDSAIMRFKVLVGDEFM